MAVNVSKLVNGLLSGLDPKQQEILEGRYGLKDGQIKTLAAIGEAKGITRERVRQIEAGALRTLKNAGAKSDLGALTNLIKSHLKNLGGLRRESLLLADLRLMVADSNTGNFGNKVRFLLEVSGDPRLAGEDDVYHAYWYVTEEDRKRAMNFLNKLVKTAEERKSEVVAHGSIDALLQESTKSHNLKDLIALNYISLSKQFHVNEYGDCGLASWPEVNPKTMRDWAHVILRKHQQPAHFRDIAVMINKARKGAKKLAHPQTVHNELIRDARFVLVGRGLYGLREFGLMPGTAREVMARILKECGPLIPNELLNLVLKERILKKNTVLINLQNKKHFKRLEDGRYTVTV